jgi:transcription antitermination factor NusG
LAALEAPTSRASHADCGRYWATAQTHPQAERWAAQCLTRRGYHVYLPLLIVQRRDRTIPTLLHRIERPLFSSYLFIQLGNTDPWTPARYTDGIRQLLMSGSKPHKLPETVMLALQAGDAFRRLPLPDAPLLRPGAPVTCLYGPFQGRDAVVIAAATNTARIALPMLGAMRELVVPIACLTARE